VPQTEAVSEVVFSLVLIFGYIESKSLEDSIFDTGEVWRIEMPTASADPARASGLHLKPEENSGSCEAIPLGGVHQNRAGIGSGGLF
jgi:hypothetical protein